MPAQIPFSVIDYRERTPVVATVTVGRNPVTVVITPDGTKAYVTNAGANSVSVIDTAANTVVATVPVGRTPVDIAVTPDGTKAYVTNAGGNSVSVISTAANTVVATVSVGFIPVDVVISPNGSSAYVANSFFELRFSCQYCGEPLWWPPLRCETLPPISLSTPDGTKAYVTNRGANSVSVIDTAANSVVATVRVGNTSRRLSLSTPDGTKVYVH